MTVIPEGKTYFVYGDKQSVLDNTSSPASILKNKLSAMAHNFVREGCAREECQTTYINAYLNVADLITNPLHLGEKH